MISPDDQNYAGLEVAINQRCDHDGPVSESSGMQVVPDDGKQINFERTGLEVAPNDQYPDLYPVSHSVSSSNENHELQRLRWPRRKWLISGGIALLLIVNAAVLGGVLGSKANKSSSTSSNALSPFSSLSLSPSSSPLNTSLSPNASS